MFRVYGKNRTGIKIYLDKNKTTTYNPFRWLPKQKCKNQNDSYKKGKQNSPKA